MKKIRDSIARFIKYTVLRKQRAKQVRIEVSGGKALVIHPPGIDVILIDHDKDEVRVL